MASFVCQNGTLTLDSSTDYADGSWEILNVTFDITSEEASYAAMGDSGYKTTISFGTKGVVFNWETTLDDTDGVDLSATLGSTGEIVFSTVDGEIYTVTVVVTSVVPNAPSDAVATTSWSGVSTSAITETTPA